MKNIFAFAILAIAMTSAFAADKGQSGNVYTNGSEGLLGATMPPRGVYFRWYNIYSSSDSMKDASGNGMDIGLKIGAFATAPRIIWVTPARVLGGDVVFAGLVPITYIDVKIGAENYHQHAAHIGDPDITTLLAWHGKQYDLAAGADWIFPTGAWDAASQVKPGSNEYTIMPDFGGSYYFGSERKWNASVLSSFEHHTAKRDQDIQMGDDFHFEWGAARSLGKGMQIGPVGYAQWKVTDDSGKDITWTPTAHDRVFAAGPEFDMPIPRTKFMMQLRGEVEFGARSRPQNNVVGMVLTRRF